jgi:hypothetical protein
MTDDEEEYGPKEIENDAILKAIVNVGNCAARKAGFTDKSIENFKINYPVEAKILEEKIFGEPIKEPNN